MREFALFVLISLVVAAMGAAAMVPWRDLFAGGVWLVIFGFALGLPTGIVYHVQLYRKLRAHQPLPKTWILRPIPLNERLRPEDRGAVLPWCYIGGLGFGIIVLGLVVLFLGMVAAWSHPV